MRLPRSKTERRLTERESKSEAVHSLTSSEELLELPFFVVVDLSDDAEADAMMAAAIFAPYFTPSAEALDPQSWVASLRLSAMSVTPSSTPAIA
eukprot:scaffold33314_cov62-Phaeocystis_antarctica.AAC.4